MTAALDLSALTTLANGDPAKLRKYSLLFIASVEEVLAQVDNGIAHADLALLGAMGHRAKSSALNIGARDFGAQCLLLEQAAKAQDAPTAIALAHSLRPLFQTVRTALQQNLQD